VSKSESATDDPAIPEQPLDLSRCRISNDVEIFWFSPQHQVTYCTPYQISDVAVIDQSIECIECISIDIFPGYFVICPGKNYRLGGWFSV